VGDVSLTSEELRSSSIVHWEKPLRSSSGLAFCQRSPAARRIGLDDLAVSSSLALGDTSSMAIRPSTD